MASIISKIFGTYSDHQIKKIMPTVKKIEALAPTMAKMTDAEMLAMTGKFKERLANIKKLQRRNAQIMAAAFAGAMCGLTEVNVASGLSTQET